MLTSPCRVAQHDCFALRAAAAGGHTALVALLLAHPVDPRGRTLPWARRALSEAEKAGHDTIAAMLVEHVAALEADDARHWEDSSDE